MAITRWDPFRDLVALQDRMNHLLEESLRGRGSEEEISTATWAPAVDVYETSDELVIKAEVPEVDRKQIDIRVENNVLTLSGERKLGKEIQKENYHRRERHYGVFSRTFTLPANVDTENIDASFKEGILSIRVPKREESKPHQIESH